MLSKTTTCFQIILIDILYAELKKSNFYIYFLDYYIKNNVLKLQWQPSEKLYTNTAHKYYAICFYSS